MLLLTSYFNRYPDLLSLKVSIDFTFVSVNIYLCGQYMWIFASVVVNIHFILQYMMCICENKEHCDIKKKGLVVREASCKRDVLFSLHFVSRLLHHCLEVRFYFSKWKICKFRGELVFGEG